MAELFTRRSVTMIYLDNSATSFNKPNEVYRKINYVMKKAGGNSGRSGHKISMRASEEIFNARCLVSDFFGADNPERICFTNNATTAINFAVKGLLKPGDHVIITNMEHNSVYRPVYKLKEKGVDFSVTNPVWCGENGIESAIKENTKMIIVNHISNVNGNKADIAEIGKNSSHRGIKFMIDASQSAGHTKIDVKTNNIDILACSGHKGLFGMQGTGILYVKDGTELDTIIEGGTGSMSELKHQPDILPDRFESGTLNTPGIASVGAGIEFINKYGIDNISKYVANLENIVFDGLYRIKNVTVYNDREKSKGSGIVAFNIGDVDSSAISTYLSDKYNIMVRGGLHCAYLAHKTLKTLEQGVVRVSLGCFNTIYQCEKFLYAVDKTVKEVL